MPFLWWIEDSGKRAHLRGRDPITIDAWRAAVTELTGDPRLVAGVPVLWDMRDVTTLPPVSIVYTRAHEILSRLAGRRVALLTRPGASFGVARQIGMVIPETVQAFTDVDEALRWLDESSQAAAS